MKGTNIICKYDLENFSIDEFIVAEEYEIKSINIGPDSDLFVTGLRFSDVRDVTIEYSCSTGEKLNEWVSEEAPPQSTIVYLSPI